jgi:hypothetical protein
MFIKEKDQISKYVTGIPSLSVETLVSLFFIMLATCLKRFVYTNYSMLTQNFLIIIYIYIYSIYHKFVSKKAKYLGGQAVLVCLVGAQVSPTPTRLPPD